MSQTKTWGMIYSANVSDKSKGCGILLECLRHKQRIWYIPWMPQTKTRAMVYSPNVSDRNKGMIYSSNVSDKCKDYGILRECLRQTKWVWYTPRMSHTKASGMMYSSNVSQKQGLWYTPWHSTKNTRVVIYSSNVSHKNKGYDILLECLRRKQGL